MSVKCSLVKTYIMSFLFYGSNVWCASKTIVRQMERLQRKNLKWIPSNSHFTDKEYSYCLRSVNLLPIANHLVSLNLLFLNKILTKNFYFRQSNFGKYKMVIPKHDLTRKYFYTQTKVIASVADVIFSAELQTTTIQCYWLVFKFS